jgi:peptide/nickel transport system substrate-binding protein
MKASFGMARRGLSGPLRRLALATLLALPIASRAEAASTVTVAITSDFVSRSPYGDTTAQMFGIWCQIYGCLVTYDPATGKLLPLLAESWVRDPENPSAWIVALRQGLKRHKDGRELRAEDVVHSLWRAKNDPTSKQAGGFEEIAGSEAIDAYRLRIKTRGPSAVLPIETFDQLIVTGKDLYDQHGPEKADREFALGWGPYELRQNAIGQRMVLEKNKNWPGMKAQNPDRLIFTRVAEAEAQLTGLHNGEVQIASLIPPHMIARLESKPGFKARIVGSAEGMFLGMNSKFPPWDKKPAHIAVAHAINKEQIIEKIYRGQAQLLPGPVGEGQFGWSPDLKPRYEHNPQKSRAILEEHGLVGTEVHLSVTTNRFLYDVQAAEAIVPMLEAVGFKVKFTTPEYATQFAEIQRGNRPFYFHSRGNMMDPTAALVQMFQTGVTARIRYSNKLFDEALAQSRGADTEEDRRILLQKAISIMEEDAPAVWLWKPNNIYGVNAMRVEFTPTPHNRVFGTDIIVR